MVDHINATLLKDLFVFSLLILDLHLFISTLALLNIVLIRILSFAQIIDGNLFHSRLQSRK